ncbi:LacI family DNA-binding transcriptional regulator [Sphingorhabdus sp.]|uniref:LacI family DNA-binding transcriptional regulator n=1 Tax=Sphingorhabdus sp. TaxID=1902408 RepID=UPI003982F313
MENGSRVRNITELAQLAGVSPGTVSRALANSHLIARKTRDRIQAIAREHDFKPNALARNLRTKRTGAIAVVIPAKKQVKNPKREPICVSMLASISSALTDRGYDLLLMTADESDPRWLNRMADSGRCDGIIVLGQTNVQDQLGEITEGYDPLVTWEPGTSQGRNLDAVNDSDADGRELVNSLFGRISGSREAAHAVA